MRHPEFPVASFLSLPLLLCSLPSHIRSGSVSIIALCAWLAVMSVIRGTNALIWADNIVVRLEVWCDITTKITIGFTYAVPASALCVLRHLESIASSRRVLTTKDDKRRRQMFETAMCFGVPMIFMALHYVVQGHRFDLIENFGCYPTQYFSLAALFILWIPPLLMSSISFVYAGLALRHFLRHRISFATHLQSSQSSITPGRYLRLMALAVVEMAWDTGINTYILWFNITSGFQPWISWENVHSNFSRVAAFPEWIFPPIFITQLIWQWWIIPISCIFFFLFFAFGDEAMSDYRLVVLWFRGIILRHDIQKTPSHGIVTVLPTISRPTNVDISLPNKCSNESEHEWKPRESFSFELRGIEQRVSMSDAELDEHGQLSLCSTVDKHASYASDAVYSLSLAMPLISTSLPETVPQDMPNQPVPTITGPESELLPIARANSLYTTPAPAVLGCLPSPIDQPGSLRRSTSGDQRIIVSPAYLPHSSAASICPEERFLASNAFQSLTSNSLHGGIHMTVERTVV